MATFWLASAPGLAQDTGASAQELQRQVEELRKALEESQRALQAERAAHAPSRLATPEAAPTDAPAFDSAGNADEAASDKQQLEAVVVRGRKQQPLEELKDVPTSVSVVTGQELENLGATDITQVLNRIGNVNFNYGNPRTGSLTLRGITTGSSDQIDPTIGTVLDGVSLGYTPLANGYPFVDIDTVSVTRGPQGTLGGKPSNIGRITFTTKAPTFTPEASLSQTFGDWNTLKTTAVLGGPVADGILAWRATVLREQGDGPWENRFPDQEGRGSYKNIDRTFARVQFLLTPSPDFKARLSYEHQPKGSEWVNGLAIRHSEPTHYTDGTPRTGVDSAYNKFLRPWFNQDPALYNAARDYYRHPVYVDNNGAIITGSKGATANLEWKLAGGALESITGWREHWFSAANDEGSPFDITKSGGYITSYEQKSQELRFTSAKGGLVEYAAGLYWLSTDNDSLGSRTRWGSDAGAYQANPTQYGLLSGTGAGQAMLRDSLNMAYRSQDTFVKNESFAAYGEADWHLSEPLTLTTGARIGWETRRTSQEVLLYDPGTGTGFSDAFGIGNNPPAIPIDTTAANGLAEKYFGAGSTWASLSSVEQQQLQAAAQIRNTTLNQGSLYPRKKASPWKGEIYGLNLALTDKINDDLTVYSALQYGEKGGIAQIDANGKASLVKKERTSGLEVGLRSSFFNKKLVLNADAFVNVIKDFQSTVSQLDPAATAANQAANPGWSTQEAEIYQSLVGNVPKVRVKGLEVDALYTGIENLTLRLAAAYNDARYADDYYIRHASDVHTGYPTGLATHYNAKGDILSNAPRFTAILGADYHRPVFGSKVFHAAVNYKWTSDYYTATGNYAYDKQKAYGLLDLGVGIGTQDGMFDANLIIRNALDENYHIDGWNSYTPSTPRWIGIVFTGRL
jgi:outer membrane receptor protein involved in Fe transport